MTVTAHIHVPRAEGEESWLHRLPPAKVVPDRAGWIVERVRGLGVAHLGFADIGCEVTRDRDGSWLHRRLDAVSPRLVGLDVAANATEGARAQGFDAYAVDCTCPRAVQALGLGTFDVVLAGELIEHVDDPGGLLNAASTLVSSEGVLIVTTPNARRLVDVLLAAVGREVVHPDHVAIYSARTLAGLLQRHGWTVVESLTYMNPRRRPRWAPKELLLMFGHECQRALANRVSPYLADGLIVVARRAASTESSDAR